MTNFQRPKNDEFPMTNNPSKSFVIRHWSLVLGHSLGIGHWELLLGGRLSQAHAHALADPRRLRMRIQLNDALQRPHVIELQRFLQDRAAMSVPVGNANDLAAP